MIQFGSSDGFESEDDAHQQMIFKRRAILVSQLLSKEGLRITLTLQNGMKPSSEYFSHGQDSKSVLLVSNPPGYFVFGLDLEAETRASTETFF